MREKDHNKALSILKSWELKGFISKKSVNKTTQIISKTSNMEVRK